MCLEWIRSGAQCDTRCVCRIAAVPGTGEGQSASIVQRKHTLFSADICADPLRYDELIRKYQTPAEREADEKAKGYGRMLEASLLRSEARIAKLAAIAAGEEDTGYAYTIPPKQPSRPATPDGTQPEETTDLAVEYEVFLLDEPPKTKPVAKGKWDAFLRSRFVDGLDEDFDYKAVDDNEEYDGFLRQLEEDNYFEDEEPEWASSGDDVDMEGTDDREKTRPERLLQGQTGVQDY